VLGLLEDTEHVPRGLALHVHIIHLGTRQKERFKGTSSRDSDGLFIPNLTEHELTLFLVMLMSSTVR